MCARPRGVGLGWRPETAWLIHTRPELGFVEVIAENLAPDRRLPLPLRQLLDRGTTVIPHGVSLSLGGAEPLDVPRVDRLARLAEKLDAPLVSEHVAFVRGGGLETGHLLPVPRTPAALEVLIDNVRQAMAILPVPLALENIAQLFEWPGSQMSEGAFLAQLVDATGCRLLLDVSNLVANCTNHGWAPDRFLDQVPLAEVEYMHIAGGIERAGFYHDTHAHPIAPASFELLTAVRSRRPGLPVLLERDRNFDDLAAMTAELDALCATGGALHGQADG